MTPSQNTNHSAEHVNSTGPQDPSTRSVVVVDDHAALRDATMLLLSRWGFVARGGTDDPERAERLILSSRPSVAIVDLKLGNANGADLVRRLLERDPSLRFLIYTGVSDEPALRKAMECGALGFALKAAAAHEFREAVDAVSSGRPYLDVRLAPMLLGGSRGARPDLTAREREVLELLAEGCTGEQAAHRLFLSGETVRTHVRNAMQKLGAHTRAHAVVLAEHHGLINPDVPERA